MKKDYVVNDPLGLHARPAALIVGLFAKSKSAITLTYGEKKVNAKSILGVMGMAIKKGSSITIEVIGEDEIAVFDKLEEIANLQEPKLF